MIMPRLAEIRKELSAARACTDSIFSLFQPETLYERPIPERHRVIFYVGHLEAFDWNQICRWTLGQSSFHDTFDSLFEAGIDPEVGSKQEDMPSDWPSLEEIRRITSERGSRLMEHWKTLPKPSCAWRSSIVGCTPKPRPTFCITLLAAGKLRRRCHHRPKVRHPSTP